MNNKGFTLVELIATIALLAVIAIISFVSINGVLKESKVKDCENLLISIKNGAKEYVSDNRYNVTGSGSSEQMNGKTIVLEGTNKYIKITANDLINGKYLSSDVKDATGNTMIADPFGGTDIVPSSVSIKVYLNSDYSADLVNVYNSGGTEVICSNNEW